MRPLQFCSFDYDGQARASECRTSYSTDLTFSNTTKTDSSGGLGSFHTMSTIIYLCLSAATLVLSAYSSSQDLVVIGGMLLIYSFIQLGRYDYCGKPTRKGFTIGRYVASGLLALGIISHNFDESVYTSVAKIAIIIYMLSFLPSKTSILKKILKVIGYFIFLAAVNHLMLLQRLTDEFDLYYATTKSETLVTIIVLMSLGLGAIYFGRRKKKGEKTESVNTTTSTVG